MPASATAVVFNLTGTAATAATFVTAWPTGTSRPVASNLNLVAGSTSPNLVTVALGTDRTVSLYNNVGDVHLIVDLSGFYTPDYGATFTPVTPTRVLDTRNGTGGITGPVGAGRQIDLALGPIVPGTTTSVVLNLTGTEPTASTYVTAWGRLDPRPLASNLNLVPGQTAPNLTSVGVGSLGSVSLYNNSGTVHLVADLAGYFTPPGGWTLTWSDDFNGSPNHLPSSTNWIFDTGHGYPGGPPNWGTGEIQNYTTSTSNISLDGAGNLRITPRRDTAGSWTSARIETRRADFKAPAGGILRIESRIQMPNVTGNAALGYWPAFWALGSPYRGNYWNWPSIGEFDIMENVNGINAVWAVLHCGINPGGPCNEPNGISASRACPNTTCQSTFHTYRFEWDQTTTPNQLRWYVDDQQFHTVNQSQLPADTWNNMTAHAGYFILLNVAMGDGFPNGVAGFPTPTTATMPDRPMVIDYVAVWTLGSGTPTTTTNPH